MDEPSRATAIALPLINGVIVFLMSIMYMLEWPPLGILLLILALLLLFGAVLMVAGHWKAGAVMAGIGGVATVPIGLLGIFGASKAWQRARWEKAARLHPPGPV